LNISTKCHQNLSFVFFRHSVDNVQQRKHRWIGHTLNRQNLLCDMLEGRMLVKATRGRKWLHMLSDISSNSYQNLKREAGERVVGRWSCKKPAFRQI